MAAEVGLPIILALTMVRSFLVVDAVLVPVLGSSAVWRISQRLRSQRSEAPARSPIVSQRQYAGPASAGGAKKASRSLHVKLVAMHLMAIVGQVAGVLKHALPVSVANCTVTQQLFVAFTLLYDSSLVTFLLAKVHVTNSARTPTCWEKGVIWLTRAYAWIYLPFCAVFVGSSYPGGTNEAKTSCMYHFESEEAKSSNLRGYSMNSAVLLVQFVLLLVLFVRPMLGSQSASQSGGAMYRRVVARNLVCTALVSVTYLGTTVIVVVALLAEATADTLATRLADVAVTANWFLTLCLTEIALPLGITSCVKACSAGNAPNEIEAPHVMTSGNAIAGTATRPSKVVPAEEIPLQTLP